MRGRYMWMRGGQRAKGYLAHLGASGLLIGGDTQLPAIHHWPLRPLDNFYDSVLLLSSCNWPHPLSFKVSPLAREQAWWGCWVTGQREGWNRNGTDRSVGRRLWKKVMYTKAGDGIEELGFHEK